MHLQTILLQYTSSYNPVCSKYDQNDRSTHLEQRYYILFLFA